MKIDSMKHTDLQRWDYRFSFKLIFPLKLQSNQLFNALFNHISISYTLQFALESITCSKSSQSEFPSIFLKPYKRQIRRFISTNRQVHHEMQQEHLLVEVQSAVHISNLSF